MLATARAMQGARHQCVIYDAAPAKYLPHVAGVMIGELRQNKRCLYINRPSMVAGIRSHLRAAGIDVNREVRNGSLVLTSDRSHLLNGRFDADHMVRMLAASVSEALREGYRGLFATGDMTWEFGGVENFSGLLEYERALEELFEIQPALAGLCQYNNRTLPPEAVQQGLVSHQSVYINQTLSKINPYYVPRRSDPLTQSFVTARDIAKMLDRLRRPVEA